MTNYFTQISQIHADCFINYLFASSPSYLVVKPQSHFLTNLKPETRNPESGTTTERHLNRK
jgi:hypothetical protein